MSENQANDLQDPAEPHKVDVAVETTDQPAEQSEPETSTETKVETTVTESSSDD